MKEVCERPVSSIWITWEHQRRSTVLAREFEASFYELIVKKYQILRYPFLLFKTLSLIGSKKPDILYVQSPSIILSAAAAFYRKVKGDLVLVVDRHSNFFRISRFRLVDTFLQALGDFALRNADVTIVTNNGLRRIVERRKGFAVVLQDKIPILKPKAGLTLEGKFNLLFPCSFFVDEPISEVLMCAGLISKDIHIYITGNYEKYNAINRIDIPENIHFLGFLNEQEYIDYMSAVDCVMSLTTWENNLLCCAYEAIALKKPLIMSNKKELCAYFNKGVSTCDNRADFIAMAIEKMRAEYSEYTREIAALNEELRAVWPKTFNRARDVVYGKLKNRLLQQ